MWVLGLESSCDETAAAVVDEHGTVLSDVVRSQIAAHQPYGGVVPEIAARDHLRAVVPVIEQALAQAGRTLAELGGIAVTARPGLVGALLVGVQAAKGLAWASGKPLVGVDHLVGHLLSAFLHRPAAPGAPAGPPPTAVPAFPFVGLLVSGGHTGLYRCDGAEVESMHELGATRDDAVGEAYDKVAKLLGLGYPGGPIVDRLAADGSADRSRVRLAAPMAHRESLEFSFSGIKSAVARHVDGPDAPSNDAQVADLCAAFQRAVTATLVAKALRACRQHEIPRLVVAGGVAANRGLRERLARACAERAVALFVPPPESCTDNGAMIAYAGALRLRRGERDRLDLGPLVTSALRRVTRKGRGRREG
ncbi:MAG: tRNA (adenosine(37)-N6)-threonylcarbamoyltransferase complex transferase subunit TsaD [Deltaproteobacteria bacterium]|nr:tRNA (adenosine(37)-N6)-threonylcarbamoyltransferase complex transferase subunit TsaD [Deltaproteobacteria bacterium]